MRGSVRALLTWGKKLTESCYILRFKPTIVKEFIREIVRERLSGVQYDPEEVQELSRSLAESVKDKVKSEWLFLPLMYTDQADKQSSRYDSNS